MIVILGGGPAGRLAAIRLATAGREVTLVEKGGIGGQCLHYGCMPVCALNDVARHIQAAGTFSELGILGKVPDLDFTALLHEMTKVQETIAGVLDKETRDAGVEILYGQEGKFDGREVVVGSERLNGDAVILSTGSRPALPDIDGIHNVGVFTPHSLKAMKSLPKRLIIIGGGIMAAEFAYIFSRFGSRVTVLSRSGFLKNLDETIRKRAERELAGVEIREGTDVLAVRRAGETLEITVKHGGKESVIGCDAILVAAGLAPNSGMLEGIAKRPNGEVIVDDYMRTNLPGIFAAGDVTGPPFLTPVARLQGIVAADNILGAQRKMDYSAIPQALNLGYELAFCSNNHPRAKPLVIPGVAGPGTFWAVPSSDTGFAKILVAPDGTLSGMATASPGGGLIAGYVALLMRRHFSVHDFSDFIEVHPSTDGVYGLAKYASEVLKKREHR
ncbi:NAD(P)/FAD-dependent oxidoreductase [Methanoregula sp.]|uniref:dihydrolipoyl dehydrogenase family protein n=1 Tax=Methanoregula sp. TaxID=2052170 RepID=UPI000CBAA9A6|nr:NAD(P)/FAD-dependent oxidoreductase [Methanoregula sp.]PKG33414.1 MAG: NAD(P)/FAD-dependent oxidoreductase [Methanoregula sp.]